MADVGFHEVLRTLQAGGAWPAPMADLKCPGVSRDADSLSSLSFHFSRRVTDDEMRFLHEVMQRAAACMPDFRRATQEGR